MDLKSLKAEMRKAAFQRRKECFDSDFGSASAMLSSVLAGYRGVALAGYLPIRTEIDPRPAMAEAVAHGPVGVPVIMDSNAPLAFSRWSPEGPLREGPFGVDVPEQDDFFRPEILIVPMLAFTRAGARLGYGGGFYDRSLADLRAKGACLAIGFAYGGQEVEALPEEPTDARLDLIVTEREVITPRK